MMYFDFNEDKLRSAILKLFSVGYLQSDIARACDIDESTFSRFVACNCSLHGDYLFRVFNYVYNELFRCYGKI